jgi:hypothetical protein
LEPEFESFAVGDSVAVDSLLQPVASQGRVRATNAQQKEPRGIECEGIVSDGSRYFRRIVKHRQENVALETSQAM